MKKNRTILIVDDEEKIVEVLKAYLEKAEYEILCAYDGQQLYSCSGKMTFLCCYWT